MKTLQNNFTTPEQSKRLLELGVPAESADCFYDKLFYEGNIALTRMFAEWRTRHGLFSGVLSDILTPCWSVGRLIEIMLLCHTSNDTGIMFDKPLYDVSNCTNIEWCIRVLESSIQCGHMDFSKLEE